MYDIISLKKKNTNIYENRINCISIAQNLSIQEKVIK